MSPGNSKTFGELSINAQAKALYEYVCFANEDGTLDNVTMQEILLAILETDYHFNPDGSLFRGTDGNIA